MENRIFLCGITSSGKEETLKALIEPIGEYINGLQWVFHGEKDAGSTYLESRKGEGEIIYAKWCNRHGYSMSHYLYQGTMKNGDFFLQVDDLERLSPSFFQEKLEGLIQVMKEANLGMIANFSKGLLFRYNEQLEFRGSPHWYALGLDGGAITIELEDKYFWNVRNEKRDKFQFVTHYLKYYLYPAGSNHCLLGLEKQGDPATLFPIRERRRLEFKKKLEMAGYENNVNGVIKLMKDGINDDFKSFFMNEKILNDAYRYLHLGLQDFNDDHDHKNMIQVI